MAKSSRTASSVTLGSDINIGALQRRKLLEDRLKCGEVFLSNGENIFLGVVADGIGGENAGERAAELTVEGIFKVLPTIPVADIPSMLKTTIEKVNATVYEEARSSEHGFKRNMGSTVVVAAIYKDHLFIANAGDSRIYLVRGKQIQQITVDHTWAYEVVRAGKLKPEEAERNPHRDEIVRSMGYEAAINVDIGLHLRGGRRAMQRRWPPRAIPCSRATAWSFAPTG